MSATNFSGSYLPAYVDEEVAKFLHDARPADLRPEAHAIRLESRLRAQPTWLIYLKRTVDLAIAVIGGALILPLVALLVIAIKLDSNGPAFYSQTRIGRNGRKFRAWKFRTMVVDADRKLAEYLARNPELRNEWKKNHKLQKDPRVTRVGKLLRKTSLDELPQLWNVITGDMSLVGPRPIVRDEIEKYGKVFPLYLSVRPGITGLWQVSGRSTTTYRTRVCLDAYYARNPSLLLDLYILARTPVVVFARTGAH